MPPWLSTFLRGTGYVMLLGLIVFATILLELLVAYQLARIFKLDIAPRLLTLLKKLTPFIAGSGNQASPGKSAVNIKRRTRSTERLELEQRTPRGWKAHAIELMAAGRGQDALRALYLALLARLDRQGLIRYDPSKTNWQYRMQLPAGTIRDAFSELSRIFDRTWYGSYPCDASAFHRGSILVDQVLRETDR